MPIADLPTGASLHYEDMRPESEQLPVILIHGMMGTARLHMGHVMDWLHERGFRVIGLTLRGYGESGPKPRDFPDKFYRRDAEDLLAFMEALPIERAHLIGYSDGGEVALIAAGTAPTRFASCIAIGAVGNFGPEMRPAFQRMYPGDWITEEDKALHGFSDAVKFTGEWLRSMTRMIDAGGDISLSLAKHISCPLIIVLGRKDKLNPLHYGERFVAAAPNGRLEVFPCGHAAHDQQRNAFYALTLRHLLAASRD
ncbi:MAG: alpha/beta fold hydrolase [Chloroflexota bacterium]|nr:alpha/beta fold hydrolase [Chloroflexota bacterium]